MVISLDVCIKIFNNDHDGKLKNIRKLFLWEIPLYYYKERSMLVDLYFFQEAAMSRGGMLYLLVIRWLNSILKLLAPVRIDPGKDLNNDRALELLFPIIAVNSGMGAPLDIHKKIDGLNFRPYKRAMQKRRYLGRISDNYFLSLKKPIRYHYQNISAAKQGPGKRKIINEIWEAAYEAETIWLNV